MPTLAANGIDIYYERSGTGPPLLFLNGSGATIETSRLVITPFTDRFDAVVHDQRGLGKTSIPEAPYSMADYAADAIAVLDHVGWDTARVVGISFGGMVAQELAVTVPDRIERLALLCTSPGGAELASYPLHELGALDAEERAAVYVPILDTRFTPEWLAEHDFDRMLVEAMGSRTSVDKPEAVRRGEAAQLQARRHHDVLDRLSRISCPTLVAAGRYDGIAPLANSEAIAAGVPGATLEVFEGGHAFFAQDRTALPRVLDFLAAS